LARLTNPFRERKSEETTSDQEFVRVFSPKILERLPQDAFFAGVHLFVSPPGAGKTTLFRAFTPATLRTFWNNAKLPAIAEAAKTLLEYEVFDPKNGPQILGLSLTCLSGYADLPPGMSVENEGVFRALLDCRIILRTLRSLALFLSISEAEMFSDVTLDYSGESKDLKCIPHEESPAALAAWAEQCEKDIYSQIDVVHSRTLEKMPAHVRFEGILWLSNVRFMYRGREVAPRRLLMIDDVQSLRRKQRELLCREIVDLRVNCPIWLAQRTAVFGEELLVPGGREGRDIRVHSLDVLWAAGGGRSFYTFAQNVLYRRLEGQDILPKVPFEQFIKDQVNDSLVQAQVRKAVDKFWEAMLRHRNGAQYADWLSKAEADAAASTVEGVRSIYTTAILIARNEGKGQTALLPLATEELDDRDSSATRGAAEIFLHDQVGLPYYYGMERLASMATNNVEELLSLAGALYESLEAKQMLRRPDIALTANEQDKLLMEAAKRKRDFIPRTYEQGTKATALLDGIGDFCRERTFVPNAPYPPGVTGVRLSHLELDRLLHGKGGPPDALTTLRKVLAECIANNLLVPKEISATSGRDSGTAFYLNRTLCIYYGLPLQYGGWQDVSVASLLEWVHHGRIRGRTKALSPA
jgi:hypothetical protein